MKQPKAYSYIRFSSAIQEKGDSLRRQLEASEEYAKQKGLTLDDSLKLTDRGLSAYSGTHRQQGALSVFLSLVQDGKIAEGSYLIVESFDRLSRETVLTALNQFSSIIQAGITLVTLQDGMEYNKESIEKNWTQLIISIVYMARAWEESEAKSKRLKASWKNRRNEAQNGKIITGQVPYWLMINKQTNTFEVVPEIAEAIRYIFELKAKGKGAMSIETELNRNPDIWKPSKGGRNKSGGWRKSYIVKILRNREVIGEYQSYNLITRDPLDTQPNGKPYKSGKKREAVGEPIEDYYPAIVSKELFNRVQHQMNEKATINGNAGGKTGKASNLFAHLAKCGKCGGAMHFINKGNGSKGGKYLHCDQARRLKTCDAKPIRYKEFEKIMFENLEEIDIKSLTLDSDEKQQQITELANQISSARGELSSISQRIANVTDTITTTENKAVREHLQAKLNELLSEQVEKQRQLSEYEAEKQSTEQQNKSLKSGIEQATEIYELLEQAKDENTAINFRFELRSILQNLLEMIKIYPLDESYKELQETEEQGIYTLMHSRYIDRIRIKFRNAKKLRIIYLKTKAEIL